MASWSADEVAKHADAIEIIPFCGKQAGRTFAPPRRQMTPDKCPLTPSPFVGGRFPGGGDREQMFGHANGPKWAYV